MSNTITPTVFYRTLNMDGLEIFFREAGPRDAPTVLLLHGFPSSSHMFRNLIPMLADKYHVVAPDFPGYGESSSSTATSVTVTRSRPPLAVMSSVEELLGRSIESQERPLLRCQVLSAHRARLERVQPLEDLHRARPGRPVRPGGSPKPPN